MDSVEDDVHDPAKEEKSPTQRQHVMDHGYWQVVVSAVEVQEHHLLLQV